MSIVNTTPPTSKKALPELLKIDRSNFQIYKNFIKDCTQHYYKHTYNYHNLPINYEVDNFFNWLQSDVLFIVKSGVRALGYVVLHSNETLESEHVFSNFFVHPNICKLNSVILSLTANILALYYADINKAKTISTYYNHTLLFSDFINIFDSKIIKLQPCLFYFYTDLTKYVGKVDSTLQNYYNSEDLLNYKNNLY